VPTSFDDAVPPFNINSAGKCGKSTQQKTIHKKLPKNLENFINSAAASTVFKENLDKNIKLKKRII
jgi:tRNA(Glu) U13 pseudouridine synthase TruD